MAVAIGGALIEPAPAAAFAIAAGAARRVARADGRRRAGGWSARSRRRRRRAQGARASLRGVLRRPGAREVLIAQTLWVLAYAAIPTFFVLYAEDTLGLGLGAAGAALSRSGRSTGARRVARRTRTSSERVRRVLEAGVVLLGGGPARRVADVEPRRRRCPARRRGVRRGPR